MTPPGTGELMIMLFGRDPSSGALYVHADFDFCLSTSARFGFWTTRTDGVAWPQGDVSCELGQIETNTGSIFGAAPLMAGQMPVVVVSL